MSTISKSRDTAEPLQRWALWWGGGLFSVAILMRINNAIRYRTGNGFDAVENVQYIELLMRSWALPSPDAAWATAHPPLFYYLAAGLWHGLVEVGGQGDFLVILPLLISLAGLVPAIVAFRCIGQRAPGDSSRAVMASALLLFLPVHVYMAPMIGEELLATAWISLALWCALPRAFGASSGESVLPRVGQGFSVGVFLGLALLTKMSAVLVVSAIVCAWLIQAVSAGHWTSALKSCGVLLVTALAIGGWYYIYTFWTYGYLYPQDLAVHQKIFEMPPGHRAWLDYLRFPLATFRDPQLLNPDLLHSVWGGTYDTIYFDGHRHFLGQSPTITRAGTALTLLGLLPTLAFGVGMFRGVRRALSEPGGWDTILLLTTLFLLVGYVLFTWNNPWYVTVKGSYLLGLSIPFAFYTSECLMDWMRKGRAQAWLVSGLLLFWIVGVAVTFTIGPVFEKPDGPGLPWQTLVR